MADPVRKVTRELRPLAKHLAMKGATFEFRSGHVYAMSDGAVVTMFSVGRSTDHRAKRNMVSQLKREWPNLLDGFEGFEHSNGDKTRRIDLVKRPGNTSKERRGGHSQTAGRQEWADATRIRLRACIDEHFEGKNTEFVRWAEEVAKEQGLSVWTKTNSGQSMIGKFLSGKNIPIEDNLKLIDAAIDAAYGTPKREPKVKTTRQIVPPSERIVVTDVDRELLDGNDRIDELEAEVARKDTRIEELEHLVDELGNARRKLESQLESTRTLYESKLATTESTGPKERYLELLFKLSEDGNEMAMDRIERMFLS